MAGSIAASVYFEEYVKLIPEIGKEGKNEFNEFVILRELCGA